MLVWTQHQKTRPPCVLARAPQNQAARQTATPLQTPPPRPRFPLPPLPSRALQAGRRQTSTPAAIPTPWRPPPLPHPHSLDPRPRPLEIPQELDRRNMLFEERLEAAERRRLEGNALFAEGKMVEALGKYALVGF